MTIWFKDPRQKDPEYLKDTNVPANQNPEFYHEPMKSAQIWAASQSNTCISYYLNMQDQSRVSNPYNY